MFRTGSAPGGSVRFPIRWNPSDASFFCRGAEDRLLCPLCRDVVRLLQLPPHRQHHGDVAGGAADDVGHRLCRKDPVGPHEVGEEVHGGDHQNHLAEQGKKHRFPGVAQSHKGVLAGALEGHGEVGAEEDLYGPNADVQQSRVVVEEHDPRLGEEHDEGPGKNAVAQGGQGDEPDALADPAVLARSEVIPQYRLGPLGEALDGLDEDLPDGGGDGHGADVQIPHGRPAVEDAVVLQQGVAGTLDQAVGDGEGKA